MVKQKKLRWIFLTTGAFVGVAAATILPGITYQYNYAQYIKSHATEEINLFAANNSTPGILTPDQNMLLDQDSQKFYNFSNNYFLENKNKPGETPDFINNGKFTPDPERKIIDFRSPKGKPNYNITPNPKFEYVSPYSSTGFAYSNNLGNHLIDNEMFGYSYFGVKSNDYYYSYKKIDDQNKEYYRYNGGFLTYPDFTNASADLVLSPNTKFKMSYRNSIFDREFGVSGDQQNDLKYIAGGTYKEKVVEGYPQNQKTYGEVYEAATEKDNFFTGGGYTLTGAKTFDISGKPIAEFGNAPFTNHADDTWKYVNQTDSGIRYWFGFYPTEWYIKDARGSNRSSIKPKKVNQNELLGEPFEFVNYSLSDNEANPNSLYQMNSVSMTVATTYRNVDALVGDKYQYIRPGFGFYSITEKTKWADSINKKDSNSIFYTPTIDNAENTGLSHLEVESIAPSTDYVKGTPAGQNNVMNVTLSLTPAFYNSEVVWVPFAYSGTTSISISQNVRPEDKSRTATNYVEALKNYFIDGGKSGSGDEDNPDSLQGDVPSPFSVRLFDGYPGCEFGATNRLFVNNSNGTLEWRYNPGSVLKNGLIVPATAEDIKSVVVQGFKRIPGVTKIASKVNAQSPFTLAQDVISKSGEPNLIFYKLIYDLAIINLPSLDEGFGYKDQINTIEGLSQLIKISNIKINNIGEKTDQGYPEGGYVDCEVSLTFYYDKATNLIKPGSGITMPPEKLRIYGFKHIEPTFLPSSNGPQNPYQNKGNPNMIPSEAAKDEIYLKQIVLDVLQTKITASPENDWRTTVGGTLPIFDGNDGNQATSLIDLIQISGTGPNRISYNNSQGTVTFSATLQKYFNNETNPNAKIIGELVVRPLPPVSITIGNFRQVSPTKLKSDTVTLSIDRTVEEIIDDINPSVSSEYLDAPYLQYIINKNRDLIFTSLPDGFNASDIKIINKRPDGESENPKPNFIEGSMKVKFKITKYFDKNGDVKSDEKGEEFTLTIKGFNKTEPTKVINPVVSIVDNPLFFNTLPSAVDANKVAAIIFEKRNEIFNSIPNLYFSFNSIVIGDPKNNQNDLKNPNIVADNLNGTIKVTFDIYDYYNKEGKRVHYIPPEIPPENPTLLRDSETITPLRDNVITITGFAKVAPTKWDTVHFDVSGDDQFTPIASQNTLIATTASKTTTEQFREFFTATYPTAYQTTDPNGVKVWRSDTVDAKGLKIDGITTTEQSNSFDIDKSIWGMLGLSNKTIFQVTPEDIATLVVRSIQNHKFVSSSTAPEGAADAPTTDGTTDDSATGTNPNPTPVSFENINVQMSDISVEFIRANPSDVKNLTSQNVENEDWYNGYMSVKITITLADGSLSQTFNFTAESTDKKLNVFAKYIPVPAANVENGNTVGMLPLKLVNGDAPGNASFSNSEIQQFIYENIDQVINGPINDSVSKDYISASAPSGVPLNFSLFDIDVTNVLADNNNGTISALVTLNNFYDAEGQVPNDKSFSRTVVFSGFATQKSTEFKESIDLVNVGANSQFFKKGADGTVISQWENITAEEFWNLYVDTYTSPQKVDSSTVTPKQQFLYDIIMGQAGGVLAPQVSGQLFNPNRILVGDSLPGAANPSATTNADKVFKPENIVGYDASFSNLNGRLDVTFRITNYYDNLGSFEEYAPKTCKIEIFGFKNTQSSLLAGSSFGHEAIVDHKIKINGSYNITASLVTESYIRDNILSKTSGNWPSSLDANDDGTVNINRYDFEGKVKDLRIIATNNSNGVVLTSFYLTEKVPVYDDDGNPAVLLEGVYELEITGFESSLMLYILISILIIFLLFIVIPAIVILVKKSNANKSSKGKISDFDE